jgi:hypothetical protein
LRHHSFSGFSIADSIIPYSQSSYRIGCTDSMCAILGSFNYYEGCRLLGIIRSKGGLDISNDCSEYRDLR